MNEYLSSRDADHWWKQKRIERTLKALRHNGFDPYFFAEEREAIEFILAQIPSEATIGFGGSITLRELGIANALEKRGHKVFDHWEYEESDPRRFETQLAHLRCDVFLTSTNAITLDGALVNSDASGNRVAAMIFGPKAVIVVAGVNKIVTTIEEGIQRIRNVVGPKHAQRKQIHSPCGETGFCVDCKGPDRRCRITTIIERRPRQNKDFKIILIGKELGY